MRILVSDFAEISAVFSVSFSFFIAMESNSQESESLSNGSAVNGGSPDLKFSAVNYSVFGLMLLLSAMIGIYFGFFAKKKQDNTVEYLLGGKKMNFFPIAASLIASHISGATFLAVPAEVYAFGSEYVLCVICASLVRNF